MPRVLAVLLLLLALPGSVRADSPSRWTEVRSPHFVVLTDAGEKQGRHIAGQFERMRTLFSSLLPYASNSAGQPITVLALHDRKGFQAIEPAAYLAKGSLDLAGLFLRTQDRNYILLRLDREGDHPYTTVYHEYTHFILRKAEWLPLWLNEGLAEFYQNTDIHDKDVSVGERSADDILYLSQNRLIPLPVLFAVDHGSPYYHDEQKGSVFYSESWALTHLIEITDFERKAHRLQDYATLLAKGGDPVAAAQSAFGDLNALTKELADYVQSSNYKQFSVKLAVTADEASFTGRPIPVPEVDAVRADVLANNDRVPEARTLVDSVLHDDPKSALAHESMGYIELREHKDAAAAKWFGEAVELGSESPFAMFYYAHTLLETGAAGKDEVIESSFRHAIQLDPSYAPAYEELGRFYAMRQRNLVEAGTLMATAARLEPEDLSLRLNLATVYMQQNMVEPALNVLNTARTVAKTPEERLLLDARMADIRQFQASQTARSAAESRGSGGAETASSPSPSAGASYGHAPDTVTLHGGNGPVRVIVRNDPAPTLPVVPASAPHRTASGVLRNVHCAYPEVLTLELEQPGRSLTLFAPDMYKINLSTSGYVTSEAVDPCKSFAGMKAKVDYAETTGASMAGELLAIQLSK